MKKAVIFVLCCITALTGVALCGCNGPNLKENERLTSSGTHLQEQKDPYPDSALISTEHICQLESWPTGCESVSAVMALRHAGVEITVDDFIDNYLELSERPFDPNKSFGGNPRRSNGKGCYAPVIKSACDKLLEGTNLEALVLNEPTVEELCEKYIADGIPVILWATLDMAEPFEGDSWEIEGKTITWIRPEHCLLLVGYNSESYIFRDPMHTEEVTYYSKAATEAAYKGLFSQSVVIKNKNN